MTTEREMLDLLHRRFSKVSQGLGDRWVAAEKVKNQAGFHAPRQCDFMAQDTWYAQGMELHGCEVKCSRADWLVELRRPEKAEAFKRYMDRWWLVVPDVVMVKKDELPQGWGLLTIAESGRLRVVRSAPPLTPEPMPRQMTVCLMRAIAKTVARRTRLGLLVP